MQRVLPGLALLTAILWAVPSLAQTAAVTTNGSVVIATGSTFQTVLAAVPALPVTRRSLTIQNNNASDNCWVYIGAAAATKGTSILLLPGGAYTRYFPYVPADAIQATCATNGNTLMSILNRLALIAILLVLSAAARGDGIWNPSMVGMWGSDGVSNGGLAQSGPVVGCAGTGFNFTLACNSQYLAVF